MAWKCVDETNAVLHRRDDQVLDVLALDALSCLDMGNGFAITDPRPSAPEPSAICELIRRPRAPFCPEGRKMAAAAWPWASHRAGELKERLHHVTVRIVDVDDDDVWRQCLLRLGSSLPLESSCDVLTTCLAQQTVLDHRCANSVVMDHKDSEVEVVLKRLRTQCCKVGKLAA